MVHYKFKALFSKLHYSCFFVFCLISCKPKKAELPLGNTHFIGKNAIIKYAKGFSLVYYPGFKVLKVNSGGDTTVYVLISSGTVRPDGFKNAQVITIPVENLVVLSSAHIALADFAEAIPTITGLGNLHYVSNTKVLERISAGKIKETGDESTLNSELIINMKPGLVMVPGNAKNNFDKYHILTSAGIPVMLNADWLETSPLGKAEWVKVMAALMNTETIVNEKFNAIEKKYNILADLGRKVVHKPKVISGMPYKDIWYVPAGQSFMSRFFTDAGTSYNWASSKGSGSLALSFENVAPIALQSDYWINPGSFNSREEIKSVDFRYSQFKPFKKNTIYNNNKRVNALGNNDYWESGTVNPQLILADMIHIFHPELLPHHQLYYFKAIN